MTEGKNVQNNTCSLIPFYSKQIGEYHVLLQKRSYTKSQSYL